MKQDRAAVAFFAVSLGVTLGSLAWVDRERTLIRAQESTRSVAHLMAAHAGAAIGEAASRLDEVAPIVAAWDLQDQDAARAIFDRMNAAAVSPSIGAIGVINLDGISLVNSWKFPSEPASVAERDFFVSHLAGNDGPIIDGDRRPGPISHRERFIYSRLVRDAAGAPHAIIAVGIFTDSFNALYAEAANWPAARANLVTLRGEVLAEMQAEAAVADGFFEAVVENARREQDGSAVIDDGSGKRLVSWARVEGTVPVAASSSQDVESVLSEWRWRAAALAVLTVILTTGFALFLRSLRAARVASQNAEFYRVAVSEVHHRVKNALQLTISMLNLRSRAAPDTETRSLFDSLSGQLVAVAGIQELLQHDTSLQSVDICRLMERLCQHLERAGTGRQVTFRAGVQACEIETTRATHAAIIVNELLANAMKHAREEIVLTLICDGGQVVMIVTDDGDGLPDGFEMDGQGGFGLNVVRMIADRIGGTITLDRDVGGGTRAVLTMPLNGEREGA
jgi:two-component sensor histidine kinase